jgi:hypothetical protein
MSNDNMMIILQHFFTVDLKIKQEMYNVAPQTENGYLDENSIVAYTNRLNDALIYIFSELKCISKDVITFGTESSFFRKLISFENEVMTNFYNCGLDINKLKNFYEKYISNMNVDFLNLTKDELVGYILVRGTDSVSMISSINEMLHYIHSYIVNNEAILKAVPLIGQKTNINEDPVSLRGNRSPIFENLFIQFPFDSNAGITDMVIINEKKLIMMVRDLGHALTIEITLNNNNARIEYFIPKLCNIDMINNLPGVNKVNENSIGATGVIETSIDLLPQTLFSFMAKVPTDSDMHYTR